MKRNNKAAMLVFILLAVIAAAAPLSADTGREIMQKVIDNQRAGTSAMDIKMTLIDRRGAVSFRRLQTLTMNENGLVRTITLFLEPANVKNTRYLTRENKNRADDQWI